jgi:hypothetical protein
LIQEVVNTIQSYELVFGPELPPDVEGKIEVLKGIVKTSKRRRSNDGIDENVAKRQKK